MSACQQLGITFDHSLPGRPRNNSLAERNNLYVIDQVSTCLLAAGLPPCYWSFALTSTCHLLNVEIVDGESAWYNLHGDHFSGESIPLGAYVHFKQSPTRDDTHKFAPRSMRGVFAGYELESGMRWSGKMLVWELDKFLDADLTMGSRTVPMSLRKPHIVDKVVMVYPLAFPLKNTFERLNGDLEALIDASWEKETREALQDVTGGDDDDGGGGDDDPGGDDPHGGGGRTKDRSREVKEKFGVDDTVRDVDATVEDAPKGLWSRRDEKAIVFQTTNAKGGPKPSP